MRIYDARFKYTPSLSTNIVSTWKRFGFKPTTDAERTARQRRAAAVPSSGAQDAERSASVTPLDTSKRRRSALRLGDKKTAGNE